MPQERALRKSEAKTAACSKVFKFYKVIQK
jgi:hypothetical protein